MTQSIATYATIIGFLICIGAALYLTLYAKSEEPDAYLEGPQWVGKRTLRMSGYYSKLAFIRQISRWPFRTD